MKRPAVFIDRDGTINEQMGYINHPSRFVLLPRVPEAINMLNESGFLTFVITNQSGVARGYFPIDLVYEIHDILKAAIKKKGATIDGIFFCPHHPRAEVLEYRQACSCRKPETGLIQKALESFEIDMSKSYVIGDRHTDLEVAARVNIGSILVKSGYGMGEIEYILPGKPKPTHIARDLFHAAQWIVEREGSWKKNT